MTLPHFALESAEGIQVFLPPNDAFRSPFPLPPNATNFDGHIVADVSEVPLCRSKRALLPNGSKAE